MDKLKNKSFKNYDYITRYSKFPYYYNTLDDKYIYGITENLSKISTFTIHKVNDYDTLDLLALVYYGRPDFYWIIADFNDIKDPFIKLYPRFQSLKIPSLNQIYYGE